MTKFAKIAAFAVVALALVAGASSADAAFTRYLTVGSTGADVVELQTILEAQGYLVMPAGVAKGTFGPLTKNAVMKWQAAVGLPATGYFGPMSIAKIMATGSTSNGNGNGSNQPANNGNDDDLSGGDGDFKDFDVLGSPNNKDVDEGESVEVFGFEFEADDSDLLVERIDIIASSTNTNVEKPWKVLEEVALVVDGDAVETVDASDEDMWDEVEEFDGDSDIEAYRLRLEDLSWKVEDGETVKAYIEVTASDDIDTDETGEWEIGLDDDGIRARNAEGIDVYEGDDTDVKTFEISEAEEGELQITVDSNDNEDVEVEVSEDDTTDDVVVYTAEVESEEGTVNVEEVTIALATTTMNAGGLADVIDTLYLFIDGEEVGSESVDGTATDSVVFDDIDVDLEENEAVDFEVRADINEQGDDEENYDNGVAFEVTDITIDFVDEQDDDQSDTDSTDGGTITLNLNALSVDLASKSAAKYGSIDTQGEYFIRFKVTAPEEEDIYIPNGAASSSATNTGAFYTVLGTTNTQLGPTASSTITTGSATSSLAELNLDEGGSDEGNGYYKISSGNTATFELHVILDNSNTSARGLKVQLAGIDYNTEASVAGMTRYTSNLDEDFRTSSVLLQAVDAD